MFARIDSMDATLSPPPPRQRRFVRFERLWIIAAPVVALELFSVRVE